MDSVSKVECRSCGGVFIAESFSDHLAKCTQTYFAATIQRPFNTVKASPLKPHLESIASENSYETEAALKTQLKELLARLSETEAAERKQLEPISTNQLMGSPATSPVKKTKAGERYSESLLEPGSKCKSSRISHPVNITIGHGTDLLETKKISVRQVTSRRLGKKELLDDMGDVMEGIFELDQEIKEAEPGGNEGSVAVPRTTLRSLPHFSKAKHF